MADIVILFVYCYYLWQTLLVDLFCLLLLLVADIDECSGGLANCSHTCNNTAGGFLCSCPIGMVLDNDRQTCLGELSALTS